MRKLALVLILSACATRLALAADDDWPKWCGPRGDCTTREKGLLDEWPEAGPKELWRQPVGMGYSSPVAVEGKVYIFGTIDGKDTLTCLSADDGKVVWLRQSPAGYTGGHPGTRATPTIDGNRVYTFGGLGDLACRSLSDGNEIWRLDVMKATGGKPPMWGSASCPTVVGDLVYVQIGTGGPVAIAVNKFDGNIAWQSEEKGEGSYAAVVPIDVNPAGAAPAGGAAAAAGDPAPPPSATRQMLAFGGKGVVGMDPATGKTLWKYPWTTQYDINAVSPVYRDGHLFLTSGYGRGCAMLNFDGKTADELWAKKEPHDRMVPPLLEGDCLYVASEGTLMCLHWTDGKVQWSEDLKLGLGGQYVRSGDKMILLTDHGLLMLVQATPLQCKTISKVQLFTGEENWASPLVYRGRLYVKGPQELVCFDIKAK